MSRHRVRARATAASLLSLLVSAASAADFDPGPKVGEALPPFEASDQDGRRQTFESLRGPNGLLLVFVRSADW